MPQQNGLAEVLNRIIVQRVRCMLYEARLTTSFWTNAVCTAIYLINHSPTTRLSSSTPYKVWNGCKPSLKYLKPFGCPAYALVLPKGKKLDSQTRKCKFIGYKEQTKAYRLWDPTTRQQVISRNIIFDKCLDPPTPPAPQPDVREFFL